MKAIQVHKFVSDFKALRDADDIMSMQEVPRPVPKKGQLLVKVSACSISPGDIIMVHGNLIFMHADFPFVPGMDVCGTVQDANGSNKFKVGDVVVAANGMSPVGGMAEYMAVDEAEAVLKPANVTNQVAAASSSAITARNAVMDHVQPGDRVLILNGSGGVGTAAIQLAKYRKASFVATTSSQIAFCKKLGADRVVNYREENWWEVDYGDGQKFDKIIDCAGGGNYYGRATKVLKPGKQGGEFIAVTGDDTKPDCRTIWKAIKFFAAMPWRPLYSRLKSNTLPKYILMMPYDMSQGRQEVLQWLNEGTLKVPLDGESPMSFNVDNVRKAFATVASGHAHGKVVVTMDE